MRRMRRVARADSMRRSMAGQSMVEFSIVCFFGLIGVLAIWPLLRIDPSDDDTSPPSLPEALRNNYQRYAFTVSTSELPDEFGDTLSNSGLVDLDPIEKLTRVLATGLSEDVDGDGTAGGFGDVLTAIAEGFSPL